MQVLGGLLLVLLGAELIVSALNPGIRVLRANYWWRLPSKTRPSVVERVPVGILGLVVIALGTYTFTLR